MVKRSGRPGGHQGEARETPTEMRRHAFCGAWLERPPGALRVPLSGGRWGLLESRRCGEKPRGSQIPQAPPGHPGDRENDPRYLRNVLFYSREPECHSIGRRRPGCTKSSGGLQEPQCHSIGRRRQGLRKMQESADPFRWSRVCEKPFAIMTSCFVF